MSTKNTCRHVHLEEKGGKGQTEWKKEGGRVSGGVGNKVTQLVHSAEGLLKLPGLRSLMDPLPAHSHHHSAPPD